MRPISRPKKVLVSARWKLRCRPPRYGNGRSNRRAPSAASKWRRISSTCRTACSRVNRFARIAWIIGSRLYCTPVSRSFGCSQCSTAPPPRKRARPATTPSARSRRWKSSRMPASEASQLRGERRMAVRVAQRLRQRRDRLVVQRDGPRAAQLVGERRIGRLQRVVPVTVAVGRQARTRDHAPLDQRERALDVRQHAGVLRLRVALGMEVRQLLVEQRGIVAGQQVLREREQRPEHDVAVRVSRADAALAIEEHEPLRPIAVLVLVAEHAQQQLAHRCRAPEREQQLDRTLAHVARAPAAARVLLEAARREMVYPRVVREPGQDGRNARHIRRCRRLQNQRTGHAVPEARGRGRIACIPIRGIRLHLFGVAPPPAAPVMRNPTDVAGAVINTTKGWPRERPSVKSNSSAAHALDRGSGRHVDTKRTVGKAASHVGVGQARDDHTPVVARPARGHGVRAVIAVQRDVVGHEKAARGAVQHAHREPQLVPVHRRPAAHLEQQVRLGVKPARAAGRHLEGGRLAEQVPGAVTLDEQPLAVRAEQPEVRVRRREEAIDADVPLREHRMEDAAHPYRRRQRRFVGHRAGRPCEGSAHGAASSRAPWPAARHARRRPGRRRAAPRPLPRPPGGRRRSAVSACRDQAVSRQAWVRR